MNEKKINGLYLSYRDFINDYISELEAWQNKYPDGTELDYLYTLEEEASRYYYYSKNEGSMFPFKDTIKIKYSSLDEEAVFEKVCSIISNRIALTVVMINTVAYEDEKITENEAKSLAFSKSTYGENKNADYYFLDSDIIKWYAPFFRVYVDLKSIISVKLAFDIDKYKNFEYSAHRIVTFIQNRINALESKDIRTDTSTNVKIVPTATPISTSTNTKIEKVTWEGSESDLLELFKTLKTLGKVEYNADNDTELLPILKATFEGINGGVSWKGSENEFYELFKALWLSKYIKPSENTDVSLFKCLGRAMGRHIGALGQMKQRNENKRRYLCDELIKEDITKELKELLKTIREKFYDFVNEK